MQERRIQRWVCLRFPNQLRLPYTLWTRRAVQALIVRRCGVKLSTRAVRGYLLRWGYAPQPPPKRLGEPGWARWGQLIAMRARLEGAEIFWGVQTIVEDGGPGRDICRDTRTERLRARARPRAQGLVAAISNRGKIRFMICGEPLTAAQLVAFLSRLTMDANRKVLLILDNLLVPASASIGEWLKSHRAQIEVIKLPGYAPQPVTVHSHVTSTHRSRPAVTRTSGMQANLSDT